MDFTLLEFIVPLLAAVASEMACVSCKTTLPGAESASNGIEGAEATRTKTKRATMRLSVPCAELGAHRRQVQRMLARPLAMWPPETAVPRPRPGPTTASEPA